MRIFAVTLDLARFLALVRRELGAQEASIIGADEPGVALAPDEEEREVRCSLADGRTVVARFDDPPADRDAKKRHLEMLTSTFDAVVEEAPRGSRSRAPAAISLQDELRGLCERASAANALVIDANSPVVWGAAHPRGVVPDASKGSKPPPGDTGPPSAAATASLHALRAVRALVESAGLRKGKRVRHVERSGEVLFLAHSFAGIYLLLLVFPAPFDELRAERAMLESIQRVERLVLALPPFDPPPDMGAGVVAIRRSRRR
jgi:hypothetical protein